MLAQLTLATWHNKEKKYCLLEGELKYFKVLNAEKCPQ